MSARHPPCLCIVGAPRGPGMFILWCAGFGVRETRSLGTCKVGADIEDRLGWEDRLFRG